MQEHTKPGLLGQGVMKVRDPGHGKSTTQALLLAIKSSDKCENYPQNIEKR